MIICIIHGPNLNKLGQREPSIYGSKTLQDINDSLITFAKSLDFSIKLHFFQSNVEGEIINYIQDAYDQLHANGIIINPAAYTHTSIAIRDALASVPVPKIEVHLSNIHQREAFRHHSYSAPVCLGQVAGFGLHSYTLALQGLFFELKNNNSSSFSL